MSLTILQGDWIEQLSGMSSCSIQCCVTSPPYWGLRDYGVDGQLGLEKTPDEYVSKLVAGFSEVRRVLKDDGTLWLNLGDCYACSPPGCSGGGVSKSSTLNGVESETYRETLRNSVGTKRNTIVDGIKAKNLIGIPWRVAFALQADGWYLRSDIIWHKPNAMPESVTDRPTRAHEYLFLLAKSQRYYYDASAIRNPPSEALIKQVEEGYTGHASKDFAAAGVQNASATKSRIIEGCRRRIDKQRGHSRRHDGFNDRWDKLSRDEQMALGSNKRDVWTVATSNFKESHFATFPPKLIEPCILAGSRPGDWVLDPFAGTFTTCQVAMDNGRNAVGIELNPDYIQLGKDRCGLFAASS